MTTEEIARLRALCEKATEAPWSYYAADEATPSRADIVYSGGHPTFTGSFSVGEMHHPKDRAFIAAARTALPAVLDEIERLQRALERLRVLYLECAECGCELMERDEPMYCEDRHSVSEDKFFEWQERIAGLDPDAGTT